MEFPQPWKEVVVHRWRINISNSKWVYVFQGRMPDLSGSGQKSKCEACCWFYSIFLIAATYVFLVVRFLGPGVVVCQKLSLYASATSLVFQVQSR